MSRADRIHRRKRTWNTKTTKGLPRLRLKDGGTAVMGTPHQRRQRDERYSFYISLPFYDRRDHLRMLAKRHKKDIDGLPLPQFTKDDR